MYKPRLLLTAIIALGLLDGAFCSSVHAQSIPWRYDYNAARKEAAAKNIPLLLDFGTKNCFWCKKLDDTTFRDPLVSRVLTQQFIPVKVKAEQYMPVVKALGIQSFPTLVYATPSGQIMAKQEGYVDGKRMAVQLRAVLQQVQQASYVTPVSAQTKPVVAKSNPQVDVTLLKRRQAARGLLLDAERDFQTKNYVCCLERCRTLTTNYRDLQEAEQANEMMRKITADPRQVLSICDKLTDRLGELYLEVARSWLRKNDPQQATPYLQWVSQACAGTRHAEAAVVELKRIRGE